MTCYLSRDNCRDMSGSEFLSSRATNYLHELWRGVRKGREFILPSIPEKSSGGCCGYPHSTVNTGTT